MIQEKNYAKLKSKSFMTIKFSFLFFFFFTPSFQKDELRKRQNPPFMSGFCFNYRQFHSPKLSDNETRLWNRICNVLHPRFHSPNGTMKPSKKSGVQVLTCKFYTLKGELQKLYVILERSDRIPKLCTQSYAIKFMIIKYGILSVVSLLTE